MDQEPQLKLTETAKALTFHPTETRTPIENYQGEKTDHEAFTVQSTDPQHLIISRPDQLVSIDLTNPLLQTQLVETATAMENISPENLFSQLYQYTSEHFGQHPEIYNSLQDEALKIDVPLDLATTLSKGAINCVERHCFISIVTQMLTGQSGFVDVLVPKDNRYGGHMTNAKPDESPTDTFNRFKDLPFSYDKTIGLIQRIKLFQ
ncbi:MAG: hypothetical protein AAB574_03150 [Patescibacteria group bacterium]